MVCSKGKKQPNQLTTWCVPKGKTKLTNWQHGVFQGEKPT